MDIGELNSKLLMMELEGLVESKPGNNYEICKTIFKQVLIYENIIYVLEKII